jgi:tetratricopeptide (TPR) repeat protein
MIKAARHDPVYYYILADYLVGLNRQADAIPYIEKAMAQCQDRVWMASEASLMIKYYLKNGQTARAARVADEAGNVYSADGLEAKAQFLEAMGKYAEALDYYKKLEERYQRFDQLVSFCKRYKTTTGRTDYDEIAARRTRSVFPEGMEQVSLKNFGNAPKDGMFVDGENAATARAGLHRGDVIVALNGIRVHSKDQYVFVRGLGDEPQLNLIVWQGKQYREIKATPPKRTFGVNLPTYAPNLVSN